MNPNLENLAAAALEFDGEARVTAANNAALSLLGLPAGKLLGAEADALGWLVLEAAGDQTITVHPAVAALKSGQAIRGVLCRARREDGNDVWLSVDAIPQTGATNGSHHVVALLTDVTYLMTRSRASRRTAGDHIVDEVTDTLAQARMQPEVILTTVTQALARLRPGIWVASLIGKDPTKVSIFVGDSDDSGRSAGYVSEFTDWMRRAGSLESTPISYRVIESGEPLLLPAITVSELQGYQGHDVSEYLQRNPWLPAETSLGIVVVPMHSRGAIIGTLGLFERRKSNPLTEKDIDWVQSIADRTGIAVENAQLYEDAVQRLERLVALQSVSLAMSASPDLSLTLKVILDHVTAQLRVDAADVLLLDESETTLTLAASSGFLATAVADYKLPADDSLPSGALASRRIETVTALSAFAQFRRRSQFAREGFKAYGAVPLVTRGKLLGALEVFHRNPLSPDQEWVSFLEALGSVAAIAIDNATMQERVRQARGAPAQRQPFKPAPQVSRVQREIVRLAIGGATNREIADKVHLSQNTVKFHMRQIFQKTGTANRTELAHEVATEGWTEFN